MKKLITIMVAACLLFAPAIFAQETAKWPLKLDKIFPDGLVDAEQNQWDTDQLKGKVYGLYFSASWCRGCVAFSRTFVPFRNKHAEEFEVVLVGFDHSTLEMHDYMKRYNMSWPAIPYDSAARIGLKEHFDVHDIPTLIVLTEDGRVLTQDGVKQIELMGDEAIAHWRNLAGLEVK